MKKIRGVLNKNNKGIASEYLPWLLISIAVLAIVMITLFLLREEGFGVIDKIKNLFSFR